ncbi:MAG: hypothetical protein IT331_02270 [Anaerolineae bacterium]|nr:hypothetical protein [Anaerolineae bacterium]
MRRFYLIGAAVALAAIITFLFTLSASATAWGNAFGIDTPGKNPKVAIDSSGGLHFVWWNPKRARIQYRFCSDPTTCGPVEKLPVLDGEAYAPALALDAQGRPNVVWEQHRDGKSAIMYSRRGGGSWTKPKRVSDHPKSILPDIAIGGDGVKHIVYESVEGDGRGIYHSTRGGGSNTLQLIELERAEASDFAAAGRNVRVATDKNGRAHMVWNTATTPSRVKYTYQTADGSFVAPILVADQNQAQAPDLAIDRKTNRVGIVWETRRNDLASFALYKNGDRLFRRDKITGGNDIMRRPRVAVDCGGRFHLVFQRQRLIQTDWNVYHRVFNPADEMFSAVERVTEADTDDAAPVISATNFIAIAYYIADNNSVQAIQGELNSVCYGDPTPAPTAFPTAPSEGWEHIPNHDARIIYTKGWQTYDALKASEDNFARCQKGSSCKQNSSAELVFTGGNRIEWETAYANNYGRADVYLDGKAFEVVDLCALNRDSAKPKFGVRTYILTGNANTPHSIKIVAVGRAGCTDGAKNFVPVDGFNILR